MMLEKDKQSQENKEWDERKKHETKQSKDITRGNRAAAFRVIVSYSNFSAIPKTD